MTFTESLLPVVDLFLHDYKATDPARHVALTGVSNDLVLSNLDALNREGARIALRCPLVPHIIDGEDHLAGIGRLSRKYPDLRGIEILPFHAMGAAKFGRIGRKNPLPEQKTADALQKRAWVSRLNGLGCSRAMIA